jgi:hypothetical protein
MSPKRDKTVPELVEKYRNQFPNAEKRFIRKLIIAEHKELFPENGANIRKLTRYLKKSFNTERRLREEKAEAQEKLSKVETQLSKIKDEVKIRQNELEEKKKRLSWIEDYLYLTELIVTEEDHKMLLDLLDTLRTKKYERDQVEAYERQQEEQAEILEKLKKGKNNQ